MDVRASHPVDPKRGLGRFAISVEAEPHFGYNFSKRLIDVLGAGSLLIILSPLLVVIAIAIKLTSRGPLLFVQTRYGLGGTRFDTLKFRSMFADAEARADTVRHLNITAGPTFKAPTDPRVTRVGRFLRHYSLDEMPQLWNVLRGEMSLVGPRPLDVKELDSLPAAPRERHSVKPGLTCIWQVSGRSLIDYDRWMELDLEYVRSRSLATDIVLLLKTPAAVFSGRGAY